MHHFHKPSTNSTVSIVNSCFIDMVATLHLDPSFRWLKVDEISPLNQSTIAIQSKQNFSKESKHHQNSMEVFLKALYVCYGDESFPWCRLVKILILKLSEFLRPCDLIVSCLVHCLYQLKISLKTSRKPPPMHDMPVVLPFFPIENYLFWSLLKNPSQVYDCMVVTHSPRRMMT